MQNKDERKDHYFSVDQHLMHHTGTRTVGEVVVGRREERRALAITSKRAKVVIIIHMGMLVRTRARMNIHTNILYARS